MTAAKPLLRQNSEMRKDRVWNWTLPAWVTTFEDGTSFNVCPQAGACAKVCYARNGTYLFPKVIESHQRNLMLARGPEDLFIGQMVLELTGKKFRPSGETRLPELDRAHLPEKITAMLDGGCAAVRIHDSGDFFSEQYLDAWTSIAEAVPDVLFYAYTKEVTLLKAHMSTGWFPDNLLICFSLGGKQDHLLDLEEGGDQHADVFPSTEALENAGYYSQDDNDLLCVLAPSTKVGIPVNNIPSFRKKLGEQTFGQMEASLPRHARRVAT